MIVRFLDIVIGGLLTGGIFALIAVGFGLQYGVARVLNIAHGEFIMLGAFCRLDALYRASHQPPRFRWPFAPRSFSPSASSSTAYSTARCGPPRNRRGLRRQFHARVLRSHVRYPERCPHHLGSPCQGLYLPAFPINLLGAVFSANRIVTLICSWFSALPSMPSSWVPARESHQGRCPGPGRGRAYGRAHQHGPRPLLRVRRHDGRPRRAALKHDLRDALTGNGHAIYPDRHNSRCPRGIG